MNWQTDNAIVLHKHLDDPSFEPVGKALREGYRHRLDSALWRTYDEAAINGRAWSTRRLITVARRCRSLKPLFFSAVIWMPKWILHVGSRIRPMRPADGA